MVWPLLGAVAAGGLAVAGGKAILGGDSLGEEIEGITEDVLEATGKGLVMGTESFLEASREAIRGHEVQVVSFLTVIILTLASFYAVRSMLTK